MKKNEERSKVDQFFKNLKQYMKMKGKQIKFSQFIHFHRDEGILSRLIDYLGQRIRMHTMTELHIQQELKKMLLERKNTEDKFVVQKNSILYVSKYENVTDQQTLIKEIEQYPQGLLVDEDFIKLTFDGIKQALSSIIQRRRILFVKSKEKSDEKFLGYTLFAYPPQIKDCPPNLYKIKTSDIEKQIIDDKKLERRFQLKTYQYRDLFQKSCKQNHNKILTENRVQIKNNAKKLNSQWEDINRACIQNYDQLIQEHIKKMAKK